MAKYRCNVCGFIYDEEKEGKPFDQLTECPVCGQPTSAFTVYEVVAQSSPAEKKPAVPGARKTKRKERPQKKKKAGMLGVLSALWRR